MSQYSYLGKGTIYAGVGGRLIPIGNASALSISADEEKKELQDYESEGGGVIASVSRVSAVNVAMTLHNLSPENIALALRGTVSIGGTTAIVDEAHEGVFIGSLVPLARISNRSIALVVKKGADTLVEGQDYKRVRAGVIPLDGGDLVDGDDILVSYTPVADNLVQALVSSGLEYRLLFDGLNEAKSGKSVVVDIFKVKFSPTKALDLIGDDFAELQIDGDVLKDESKTGTGISQYFSVRVEVA